MVATKVIKPAQELKIKEAPLLAAPVTGMSHLLTIPEYS